MNVLPVVTVAITAGSAATAGGVALLAWRRRRQPGGYALVVLTAAVAWWSAAYTGEIGATTLDVKLLFARLQWFGSVFVPVAWAAFALEYTGNDEYVSRRNVAAACAIPLVSIVLVWTDGHELIRRSPEIVERSGLLLLSQDWGPWFWLVVTYSHLLAFLGSALFVALVFRSPLLFRNQSAAMLVAAVTPWVANGLYLADAVPVKGFDPTPVGFAISVMALLVAVSRFRLLETSSVSPRLARSFVLDAIDEVVVVTDADDRIVDRNDAALDLLGDDVALGERARTGVPGYGQRGTTVSHETDGSTRVLAVETSPLRDHHDRLVGHVAVLSDVTERRRHEQQLEVLNRVLRHNLRNAMSVVHGYADAIETGRLGVEEGARSIKDQAFEVVELGRKARLIDGLLADEEVTRDPVDVGLTIERAVGTIRESHPGTEIRVSGPDRPARWGWIMEHVVENLLENACEHNDSPEPRVTVDAHVEDDDLVLTIADNGPGIPAVELEVLRAGEETSTSHGQGLGLWLVNWSVQRLGGTVRFADNEPRGTVTTVRVPCEIPDEPVPA